MASPPSPNDLTRQQLDELDSLLQRMLSLPLTTPVPAAGHPVPPPPMPDATPAPSAVSGAWRSDAATAGRVPYLAGDAEVLRLKPAAPQLAALAQPTMEAPPATWGPDPLARHTPRETPRLLAPPPVAPEPPPYPATTGTLRGVDAPALPAGYRTTPAPVPPPPAPVVAPEPPPVPLTSVAEDPPSIPLPLWPVFGVNWALEALLGLLGPVGTLMTMPFVKHLLGGAGVLLVIGSGVWVARGMGYITLPWPR